MPKSWIFYDENGEWDYAIEIDDNSIQNLLERADFDWETGAVVAKIDDKIVQLAKDDSIITKEFVNSHGFDREECLPFFAEDVNFIYSMSLYDGKYWCSKTPKSLKSILSGKHPIPILER